MRKYKIYNRNNRPKLEYPKDLENYIEYEIHEVKKSTGNGIDDFEVIEEIEEVKTNIVEFINSFEGQCGVEAIMKKVAATGDMNLLNEKEAVFMDTTFIPDDPEEAFKKAQAVEEAYNNIDPALTNGLSMEDFIKNMSEEKINAYIEKLVEEKMRKEKEENENSK